MNLHCHIPFLVRLCVLGLFLIGSAVGQQCGSFAVVQPKVISMGPSEEVADITLNCYSELPSDLSIFIQTQSINTETINIVDSGQATVTIGAAVTHGETPEGAPHLINFNVHGATGSEINLTGIKVNSTGLQQNASVKILIGITSGSNIIPIFTPIIEVARVLSHILIDTSTLQIGSLGKQYDQKLIALGGAQPYSNWSISSGSLPPGLTLDSSTGEIKGNPSTTGSFNFSVTVDDANGVKSDPVAYTLTISSLTENISCNTFTTNILVHGKGENQLLGEVLLNCSDPLPSSVSVVVELGSNSVKTSLLQYPEFFSATDALSHPLHIPDFVLTEYAVKIPMSSINSSSLKVGGLLVNATLLPSSEIYATVRILDSEGNEVYKSNPSLAGTVIPLNTPIITNPSSLPDGLVSNTYLPVSLTFNESVSENMQGQVLAGRLPQGMIFDGNTLEISGVPIESGTFRFVVGVSDLSGVSPNKIFSLKINGPVSISTTSLPAGATGVTYQAAISAKEGTAPYSDWVVSSGTLPAGLSLDAATGIISGIPTIPGAYSFKVQVKDSTGNQSPAVQLSIAIGSSPIIITSALPMASIHQPYLFALGASGGTTPYPLWVVTSGTLPAGLTLGINGTIVGTPTTAGIFNFAVSVKDSSGIFSPPKVFSINVHSQQLIITNPPVLPETAKGAEVIYEFLSSGGTAPYTWSLTGGAVPAGMVLNPATGSIGGAPERSGIFNFTLTVRDSQAKTASQSFTLTVTGAKITTSPVLPTGELSDDYTLTLSTSSSTTTYVWTLASGTLPPGLTLFSNGVISGKPLFPGTTTFSVRATEVSQSGANSGLKALAAETEPESMIQTFTITVPVSVNINTIALRDGTTAFPYTQRMEARGGSGNLSWMISDGSLPDGMSLTATGELAGSPTVAGIYNFSVRASDASGNSDSKPFRLRIMKDLTLAGVFSHIAAGRDWDTSMTLVNPNPFPVDVKLNFRNSDGKPLALSFTGSAETTALIERTIQPHGSLLLQSGSNESQVLVGSAQVFSSGSVTGYAIFRQKTASGFSEGTVMLEQTASGSFVLPFDNSDGFGTGVGFTSLAQSGSLQTSVMIRDDSGNHLGSHSLILNGGGHKSFMVAEEFPATAGKKGSIEFRSSTGTGISGIGLRFASDSTFTSIPLSRALQSGVFSQIASGGSWKTTLNLSNPNSDPVIVKIAFQGHDGNSWVLPVNVISRAAVESLQTAVIERTIAPRGSLVIETEDPQGSTNAGWARVSSSGTVTGYTIFRHRNDEGRDSEGTTPLETSTQSRFVLPFDNSSSLATGIALVSPIEGRATTIRATLWDEQGKVIGSKSIVLKSKGHVSFMAGDQFPESIGKKGYILFEAPANYGATGIGLRFSQSGTFTSIPSGK